MASGCWRTIGVRGDRSCPELAQYIHCRNCPVYGMAAEHFFDRAPPAGYADQWTAQLAEASPAKAEARHSALLFRIGDENLALPATAISEICDPRPVRRIAHRSDRILLGLVAIRGRVQLCVSLRGLLGIAVKPVAESRGRPRFVVISSGADVWVFDVDEVHGVQPFSAETVRDLPSTLSEGVARHARGILSFQGKDIGYLSEQLVLESLRKAVT